MSPSLIRVAREPSSRRFRACAHLGGLGGVERILAVDVTGECEDPVLLTRMRARVADDCLVTARLLADAKAASRVAHPNVVRTLACWEEREWVFVATEYLRGQSLADILSAYARRAERMPTTLACGVVADGLRGLGYSSEPADHGDKWRGRLHGGLSASSIFVTYHGRVVLVDYGLSRVLCNASVTQTHRLRYWLRARAEEVLSGQDVDEHSDLYSLGIVLWEALSGRSLCDESGTVGSGDGRGRTPSPPSRYAPELPSQLDALVARALAPSVGPRYASGRDFLAALTPFCEAERSSQRLTLQHALRSLFPGHRQAEARALAQLRAGALHPPTTSMSRLPLFAPPRIEPAPQPQACGPWARAACPMPNRRGAASTRVERWPNPRRTHAPENEFPLPLVGLAAIWHRAVGGAGSSRTAAARLVLGLLAVLLVSATCSALRNPAGL